MGRALKAGKAARAMEVVIYRNDSTHIRVTRVFAYATSMVGLTFSQTGDSYKIPSASSKTLSGTVYIPAFWRPKAAADFDSYKPVSAIGSYVFENMQNITGVVIPQSVTPIEHNAFYSCAGILVIGFAGDSTLKLFSHLQVKGSRFRMGYGLATGNRS